MQQQIDERPVETLRESIRNIVIRSGQSADRHRILRDLQAAPGGCRAVSAEIDAMEAGGIISRMPDGSFVLGRFVYREPGDLALSIPGEKVGQPTLF